MNSSNIKTKNTSIQISFTNERLDTLKVYKLNGTNDSEDITPELDIVKVNDELYTQEFTTPNEDCILVVSINSKYSIIVVGNPSPMIVYCNNTEDTYRCIRTTIDGDVLDDDDMVSVGNDIYVLVPSDNGYSIVNINGQSGVFYPNYGVFISSGVVTIPSNSFKGIHLNVDSTVGDYLVKEIELQNDVACTDVINYFKAYVDGEMYTFIPGSTPVDSIWNFKLVADDGIPRCVWVDSKELDEPLVIEWES